MVCGRPRSCPYPRKLTEHLPTASNPQLTPLTPQLALRQLRSLLGSLLACRHRSERRPSTTTHAAPARGDDRRPRSQSPTVVVLSSPASPGYTVFLAHAYMATSPLSRLPVSPRGDLHAVCGPRHAGFPTPFPRGWLQTSVHTARWTLRGCVTTLSYRPGY